MLTYHEEGDGEVLPAAGLERPERGAHDGAADPDEGDHDDEPPDRHRLRHVHAAAVLGGQRLGRHARPRQHAVIVVEVVLAHRRRGVHGLRRRHRRRRRERRRRARREVRRGRPVHVRPVRGRRGEGHQNEEPFLTEFWLSFPRILAILSKTATARALRARANVLVS